AYGQSSSRLITSANTSIPEARKNLPPFYVTQASNRAMISPTSTGRIVYETAASADGLADRMALSICSRLFTVLLLLFYVPVTKRFSRIGRKLPRPTPDSDTFRHQR